MNKASWIKVWILSIIAAVILGFLVGIANSEPSNAQKESNIRLSDSMVRIIRGIMLLQAFRDAEFCSKFDKECTGICRMLTVVDEMSTLTYKKQGDDEDLWILPSEIKRQGNGDCDDFAVYFNARMLYTGYRVGLGFILLDSGNEGHIAPLVMFNDRNIVVFDFVCPERPLGLSEYLEKAKIWFHYKDYRIEFLFPEMVKE